MSVQLSSRQPHVRWLARPLTAVCVFAVASAACDPTAPDGEPFVRITPLEAHVGWNDTVRFTAQYIGASGKAASPMGLTWRSSDSVAVPAVMEYADPEHNIWPGARGLFHASLAGTYEIIASQGGVSDTAILTIDPPLPIEAPVDSPLISSGAGFTCALATGDVTYCWGSGPHGQIGTGGRTDHPTPTAVSTQVSFRVLATGSGLSDHMCALDAGGRAWCWGKNTHGQLGTGATGDALRPVAVDGELRFTSLGLGLDHTCGVTTDAEAYCWGKNHIGQLGVEGGDHAVPTRVSGALAWRSVVAGAAHSCGLTTTGLAYCWGIDNATLGHEWSGHSDPEGRRVPALVRIPERFHRLSAGHAHTCAAALDGNAYCWGGDRTLWDTFVPGGVLALEGHAFAQLTAGRHHACGLDDEGRAVCWGANGTSQLGIGRTSHIEPPVSAATGLRFAQLSGGGEHTCGVSTGGAVYCWGRRGAIGDGVALSASIPEPVAGGHAFTRVDAEVHATCGLAAGALYCWGGRWGVAPGLVDPGPFVEVATGAANVCALDEAGALSCWGDNGAGQLGSESEGPLAADLLFTTITAGRSHTCGLDAEGQAFCWGLNTANMLNLAAGAGPEHCGTPAPYGGYPCSKVPRPVDHSSPLADISANAEETCTLDRQGAASCFSGGSQPGPFKWVIAAPESQYQEGGGCGITVGGETYCWNPSAVRLTGDPGFARLTAGVWYESVSSHPVRHACGLTDSGDAYCWGSNGRGQLGTGGPGDTGVPALVAGGHQFTTIAAGGQHTCAATTSGAAFCWGDHRAGQLGSGVPIHAPPARVAGEIGFRTSP